MSSIIEQVRLAALKSPQKTAVRSAQDTLSFQALEGASNHLARLFAETDAHRSVAHLGPSGPAQVVSLLAAQKAGRPFLAIDDKIPAKLQLDRMESCGVQLVTTDASARAAATQFGIEVVEVQLDQYAERFHTNIAPDTVSHIRFTSGSTGKSRGVSLTHGHTERMTAVIDRFLPANSNDNFALLGQFWPMVMLRAMAIGATLHCINFDRIGVMETRRRLREEAVTALFSYPQAVRAIFGEKEPFPDVRYIHVSGDFLTPSDLRVFRKSLNPDTTIHASFGSTEFPWIAAKIYKAGTHCASSHLSIGEPVFPNEVTLLREDGMPCQPGETGEIVVQSPDLPGGYMNDPDKTREYFEFKDGTRRFRTGDMGFADENKGWVSRGRRDDMVNVRGANVWLGEIERILATNPAIDEAALTTAPSASGETSLAAFYTAPRDVDPTSLRLFLRARLPGHMAPSVFKQVDALPKTETGKLRRADLPDIFVEADTSLRIDAPKGTTEELIASVWRKLLGSTQLDRNADFLDLGGDSFMAVTMLGEVEAKTGRRIPMDILSMEGGSISALAQWIDSEAPAASPVHLRDGSAQKLMMFAVGGGHLSDYLRMVEVFHGPHEILGLRPSDISPGSRPRSDMVELSKDMLAMIPSNTGPLEFLGYSFGALAAHEAAYQAIKAERTVKCLVLIDPPMDWQSALPTLRFLIRCLRAKDFTRFVDGVRHLAHAVPRHRRIDAAHLKAALAYSPRMIVGVPTLMILSQMNANRVGLRETWMELLGGNVEFRSLPFSHTELMRHPAVDATAEIVAEWLGSLQ